MIVALIRFLYLGLCESVAEAAARKVHNFRSWLVLAALFLPIAAIVVAIMQSAVQLRHDTKCFLATAWILRSTVAPFARRESGLGQSNASGVDQCWISQPRGSQKPLAVGMRGSRTHG